MKKWIVLSKNKIIPSKLKEDQILNLLLKNRNLKKNEIESFLDPKLEEVTAKSVGIDSKELEIAILRIKKAIKNNERIVVFGDYDVDGICGSAILWETLNHLGAKVMPYIPHRIDEGYGLSIKGIDNILLKYEKVRLIITVDNGIVASSAVEHANKEGIDVIITDHHVTSKNKPKALAIVHTTKLCGTGVAYLLAQKLKIRNEKLKIKDNHLELVALATVADLVPLKGANRTLLKFGLNELRKTRRIGLLELFKEAGIPKETIGVYEIGHIIAPRLNAMGRLEYAMDSLRLICTNNKKRAEDLAALLGNTNKERQEVTLQAVSHALEIVNSKKKKENLLFISHETYEQGVIGLVAGRVVEQYYRPTIVVSIGQSLSKGSARSISGFNMIEFIRGASNLLVDAGGHPMAAGFTVETSKLSLLKKALEEQAEKLLTEDVLTRRLKIDCELPLSLLNLSLYEKLQNLAPFGMGNPEPTFLSKNVLVQDIRLVGAEGKHLRLYLADGKTGGRFEAIGFGLGGQSHNLKIGDKISIAYVLNLNEWNGEKKIQLKIRDFN